MHLDANAGVTAHVYRAEPPNLGATFILAHGAGAGQRSAFMVDYARALAERGLDVVTFDFPYMEQRRHVPDRRPVLEGCYRRVIDEVRTRVESSQRTLCIGGKSMGGRMATYLATDAAIALAGLVLLGYPLHPPGKPDERRDAHLPDMKRPVLIVQGRRDTFGTPDELAPVLAKMSPAPDVLVIEGGDHSFKVPGGKAAQAPVHARIHDTIATWIGRFSEASSRTHEPRR